VKPTVARLSSAVLVVVLAGCGAHARTPPSSAAPDPERVQDLVPLTRAEAVHAAERIALVRSLGSEVVERAPGTPFTRTRFDAEAVLKGRLPRRIAIEVIGGRIGDSVVESPVQAFVPARRYVLFLGPDGPAGPTIFPQAVVEVGRDAGAVVAAIERDLR
jgi:hypothetical protein